MNAFLSLSQAVARVSQRSGAWPNVAPALATLVDAAARGAITIYGVSGDRDGDHAPVPGTALMRELRLGALRGVQVAGAMPGMTVDPDGGDKTQDWRWTDADDKLLGPAGKPAWRRLCVLASAVDELCAGLQPPVEKIEAPAPSALRSPYSREREKVIAWLLENYPAPPQMTAKELVKAASDAGVRNKKGEAPSEKTVRRALQDAYGKVAS